MPDRPNKDSRIAPISRLSVHATRRRLHRALDFFQPMEQRLLMAATPLIAAGATWKYLDNGTNQGTAWEATTFNDASWTSGPAQLGYGDGDEATVVSYGPSSGNKYITTYFRKSFTISNPASITAMTLELIRDDGAVVYLNGTEIYRNNMPSGTITYTTLASTAIGGTDESTWYTSMVNPAPLVSGTNEIAVEMHQSDSGSSDLSFDFQLNAVGAQLTSPSAPSQVSAWTQSSTQTNVSWTDNATNETGFKIERSTDNQNFTQIGTAAANATNFLDNTGTVFGTTYYYHVRATNASGDSAYSPAVLASATPAHVLVVIEENEDAATIVNSADAPYVNSLISGGAYFSDFHAITHPSEPNYIALFSGSTQGVTTDDIPSTQFAGPDLASQLIAAGKSFTGYSEDLPAAGSLAETGGAIDPVGSPVYARKHNPWSDFADVPSVDNQPLTSFPADFSQLPALSFVVPNLMNDMHDGTVNQGDAWLQTNLGAYAIWARAHNSLLVVTWDEDESGDDANVIPTFFYGAGVQAGSYSETVTHYSLLRTLEDMHGLSRLGAAATASPIQDVWPAAGAPVLPAAPSDLLTTTVSSSQINLSWTDNSNNETGFIIERSTSAAGGWTAITSTLPANTITFSDTSGLVPGTQYFYRARAANAAGASVASTPANATTLAAPTLPFIPAGSTWKYLDDGSNEGTTWEASGFNDSAWKSGPAQLGYGDGDEATVVSYGPNANSRFITTYFRKSFNVNNPAQVAALNLGLLRDDGAVVYLNGTEVFRSNMPAGTITYTTLASTNVNGTDESTFFPGTIAPSLLVAGTNVIAVEIHQSAPDSSDLSFDFSLAATTAFAYMNGSRLNVEFDGTATPITLGVSGGAITATKGGTTLTFNGVTSIDTAGTSGNDSLQLSGAITPPLTFTGGGGIDSIRVTSGSTIFANDLSASLHNVTVTIDPGAAATFASSQHLASLVVNGNAALSAGGVNNLFTNALTIAGKLDIRDNALFLNYSGASPLGTASGGVYNGITGLVQSGRRGGTWTGNGIITSISAAVGSNALTTLGVAEASDALGLTGAQTAVWNGQTVDATTVLIKYTYVGDANLDGVINGDDYFLTDAGYASQTAGYVHGDFDYNGRIDADDYFTIDSHYNKAAVALSAPVNLQNVSTVKRPTTINSPALFSSTSIPSAYDRLTESDELL